MIIISLSKKISHKLHHINLNNTVKYRMFNVSHLTIRVVSKLVDMKSMLAGSESCDLTRQLNLRLRSL